MMRSSFTSFFSASLACLFLAGCHAVGLDRPQQSATHLAATPDRVVQESSPSIAPSTPVASLAQPQSSVQPPQSAAQPGVTQVAYEQAEPMQQVPVQTIGFANGPIRVALEAAKSRVTDGCQACNSASCGPEVGDCQSCVPGGYVEYVPQGWNAFGVDPQEFICDGGDHQPSARVTRDDSIDGLQPEDTIVHYTTDAGDIVIQPSNRVCVYSPRFASVRKITGAVAGQKVTGLNQVDLPVGTEGIDKDLPGLVMRDATELGRADMVKRLDFIRDRNRGVRVEGDMMPIQGSNVIEMMTTISKLELHLMLDEQKALLEEHATAAIAWTIGESVEVAIEDLKAPVLTRDASVEAFTVYDFPEAGRLRIIKMADKNHAQSGEEVGFVIRVQNVGDSAVNNVVITDNLVTRLEYVAESQTTDRKTDFEAFPNSGDSLRLEWKLTEELEVGESLLIEFHCKMR